MTIKTYLPGYVDIPASKNMTFDAALIIKFLVNEETDKIVLNSLKLNFPDNVEEIKILQDKTTEIEEVTCLSLYFKFNCFLLPRFLDIFKNSFCGGFQQFLLT